MRKIIPIITFFFFLGCAHEAQENGKNILPKDKMIQILLDVHLTEAMFDMENKNDEGQMEKLSQEYQKIFKMNEVTSEEFYITFDYYLNHPEEMDSVYKELVDEATQQQSEWLKTNQQDNPIDSVKEGRKSLFEMRKKK